MQWCSCSVVKRQSSKPLCGATQSSRVCVSSLTDHAGEAAFAWLDDDVEWAAFVSGALVATNLRYASVLGGVHPDTLGMDASTQDKPAMVDELDYMG